MDQYKLERYPFACTASSRVYLGTDIATGERLAVKVVESRTASGERRVRRLVHGAALVSRAGRHPGLVGIRGVYALDGRSYIVMDYAAGGSLLDHITRRGPLREGAVAVVVRQLLEALAHLHGFGLMHRDLKTENVLIRAPTDRKGPPERVCICDFGFTANKSPTNECVGSPQYSAPEVAMIGLRQGKPDEANYSYDEKCDIWSLGVVTYACLSGMLPFDGSTPTEVFTNILSQKIPFPPSVWQNVSGAAREFVLFLMTPEPSKRPSSWQALRHPWLN